MIKKYFSFILFLLFNYFLVYSQDLQQILSEEEKDSVTNEYTEATFKTSKLNNGRTIEAPAKNEMLFIISHRFGLIEDGLRRFYGLDESANIRFGFEYGIFDKLSVGIGRSRFELYDGFLQYKLLRQQSGKKNIPITVSLFAGIEANTSKPEIKVDNFNQYRFTYSYQVLIASKLSRRLSLQFMPTLIHKNLVKTKADKNDIIAIGAGGRFKITNRVAISGEYYYLLPDQVDTNIYNPLSFGIDIETGGHIFQLQITNSMGMVERSFITATNHTWNKGEVLLGFNICRNFSFNK